MATLTPEARAAFIDAIDSLTRKKIKSEAYDPFIKMIQEVNESIKKADFPLQRYFEKNFPRVLDKKGLLDGWITSIALSSFAMGIASNDIKPEDIEKTKLKPCTEYPDCIPMMLKRFLSTLDRLEKAIT